MPTYIFKAAKIEHIETIDIETTTLFSNMDREITL